MIESIQNNDNRFESVGNEKMQDFENKFSSAEASFGVNRLKENTDSHNKIIRELFSNAVKLDTTETSHISETELRQTVIIGDDDRETVVPAVYPYNCICLLEIISATGKKYFGTGFLISPRCIITAGHCVNIKKEWVKSVEVSPGAKGNIRPFGSCKATRFRSVKGWTKKGNTNFDYGAIILPNTKLFDKVKSYLGYGLIFSKCK